MSRLLRAIAANAYRCALKVEAVLMLAATGAALKLFRLRVTRRILTFCARHLHSIVGSTHARTIVKEVEWARWILRGSPTCLAIALTAEALLMQHGHSVELWLGAKRSNGKFEAHVWVEQGDFVIVGGPRELTLEYARFSGRLV